MKTKNWVILPISLALVLLAGGTGVTRNSFLDLEGSSGNSFQAWTSTLWLQTTEDDFNAGVLNDVDTSSSPGDVELAVRSGWYNEAWAYRKQITIDHTRVEASLTGFPVLISMADADLEDTANGGHVSQSDGGDILFTKSDGTTKLDHEIERYIPADGELIAWVEIDSLSATEDTVIYLYYGNAACSDQWNIEGTWDANFMMVQHMEDDPDPSHTADSTSNGNDGTKKGADEPNEASGKIGGAQDFDGSDDYVNCGDAASLQVDYITVEGWAKFDVNTGKRVIASIDDGSNRRWALYLLDAPYRLRFFVFVNNSWRSPDYPWQPTPDTWYYVVGIKSPTQVRTYINGEEVGAPQNHPGVMDKDPMDLRIGVGNYPGYFDGIIDEIRISDTARSAEWIKTCYNNQNSPAGFYSVGSEEDRYFSSGTIASQVLDTGITGDEWNALFWDETVPGATGITFEARASDTLSDGFPDTSWVPVGGSPVISGLPSGQYMQWRATLTTSDAAETPTLHEVRVYHY